MTGEVSEKKKLDVLRHAIGWGRESSRNHFVAGEGSDNCNACRALVAEGRMVEHRASDLTGGDPLFVATPAGRQWAEDNAPPPPKLTAGQKRYREYLKSNSDLSFFAWLERRQAVLKQERAAWSA